MSKIPTPDKDAQKKPFHNEWINVYPAFLSLDKIHFWDQNNRTIFTFERLTSLRGKELKDLSLDDITQFVAEQDMHKLQVLADSIERNGVQVPLIIRDDGKLLDGNRRYFACQLLKMQYAKRGTDLPDPLLQIPVFVIRKADLDKKETLELKILAEANFIPDLKIPWPLDAQARAVYEYYTQFKKKKAVDDETALAEVVSVFGISRQRAKDLLESLKLTKLFIAEGDTENDKIRRRAIVEDKFVYFWEFLNKAMKGSGEYTNKEELDEVKNMFFGLMAKGPSNPITNVKQIEPLVQAKRDKTAWNILKESKGQKVKTVVSIMIEKKEVRKAEDKIRLFLAWLEDVNELTTNAKAHLLELAKIATKKAHG
jgi:ParB-like chromosome segregation protein Spo0J